MYRELPLYIFVRNAIILCLAFFVISALIIERGRYERGENSLFNNIIIKQNNIRDYNNFNITNSQNTDPIHIYSNHLAKHDSIYNMAISRNSLTTLVNNVTRDITEIKHVEL